MKSTKCFDDLVTRRPSKARAPCLNAHLNQHLMALPTGGGGEIRTHGRLPVAGFQDRCNRPLCHTSMSRGRGADSTRSNAPPKSATRAPGDTWPGSAAACAVACAHGVHCLAQMVP